jgi:sigma-B regulation protein RsbU (phosphoserine phosphatase)
MPSAVDISTQSNFSSKEKSYQLQLILELTQSVNHNASSESLFQRYRELLDNHLVIDRYALYTYQGNWQLDFSKNVNLEMELSTTIDAYKESQVLDKNENFTFVISVYHKEQPLAVILLSKPQTEGLGTDDDIISFLQTVSNIILLAVENKRLFKKELERLQYDKELELASKVQNMLLPAQLPRNSLYEFSGKYLPYKGIGGDYYDVIHINKNEFIFCIADISGKGVAAALVMANIQAYLNAASAYFKNLEDLVFKLNKKVFSITKGDGFITLFIAKYNIISKELQYINAGHTPPVVAGNEDIFLLEKGCTLLGVFEYLPTLESEILELKDSSLILCYTDGLTELMNTDGEAYGSQRLYDFVHKNKSLTTNLFNKLLFEDLARFRGENQFDDDISVLSGRFF